MTTEQFYHLTGPVEWATAPAVYSYTSLRQIEKCPLAWQLQNSKYAHFERYPVRPNPAGIEGEIVHEVVERLLREVAGQGMPAIASESFKKCVYAFDLPSSIGKAIEQHLEVVKQHPRGRGFRLLCSIQDLQNKVVRLFREQYAKLKSADCLNVEFNKLSTTREFYSNKKNNEYLLELLKKRIVLTEVSLTSEYPPFKVKIDLIVIDKNNDIVISDLKSCKFNNECIDQLLLYSTILKIVSKIVADRINAVCIDRIESIDIKSDLLDKYYSDLIVRIAEANNFLAKTPAEARPNDKCRFCSCRQLCDKYWKAMVDTRDDRTRNGIGDAEIVVEGIPTEYGFNGKLANGKIVNVVYGKDVWKIHGPFVPSEKLRIIGVILQQHVIELKAWSEIFHCGQNDANEGSY